MKFMKLGDRPDTFYTEEATRALLSDVPSDLTVKINNITYLLHKYPLLPKSGLLQRLYSESGSGSGSGSGTSNVTLELHDIPGGDEAFEVCAKFCYGITINISAHNIVSTLCAAKFLRMNDEVESGNLIAILDSFLSSCILNSWKDPIVALQSADKALEWSENLGIVRRCIESIVDKILTPPSKVEWSYTYTRRGYEKKKRQHSVPKDWWTEDISFLNVDMFRCVIAALKSTRALPPQLIGEALHVYACRWLLSDITDDNASREDGMRHRLLETLVSLIPAERVSVSTGFLLRLLGVANAAAARAELVRMAGAQLEEATIDELLVSNVEVVETVVESFVRQWKRRNPPDDEAMRRVGKVVDSYLQAVASGTDMTVQRVSSLVEALPGIARPDHDDLYKAIDVYLKEHPELSKTEKKQLCRVLDCRKLSPETCAHAVRNEQLPLRTVVQVLFFEREKTNANSTRTRQASPEQQSSSNDQDDRAKASTSGVDENSKLVLSRGGSKNKKISPGVELNPREKALIRRISRKSQS